MRSKCLFPNGSVFIMFFLLIACQFVVEAETATKSTETLVVSESSAEESADTRDGKVGLGKGLFVTTRGNKATVPDGIKGNPHVTGVQGGLSWAMLEPKKGEYNWDVIEDFLSELHECGKKGSFKFISVSGKVFSDSQIARGKGGKVGPDRVYHNTSTPEWLWDEPDVKRFGGIQTPKGILAKYPVYWDSAYQKHLENFIKAFAERYNGDPRIEYIRMGGWQCGTNEPSFYGGASEFIVEQLIEEGMDIRNIRDKRHMGRSLTEDSLYAVAVKDLMDIWIKHVTKTRLAATIHFSKEEGSFEEAMMKHCFERKIMIMNTGLNEKDKLKTRTEYREAHDKHGIKVAWGGMTHVGQHKTKEELAERGNSLLMECFMQGIGDDNKPNYAPASKVSYLVFGDSTPDKDPEAVKWAFEHLLR